MLKLYFKIKAYIIDLLVQYNKYKDGFMIIKPCEMCNKKYLFDNLKISVETIKYDNVLYICKKCDKQNSNDVLGNNFSNG